VGFNQSCELIGTYDSKGYSSFRVDSTYTPDSLLLLREAIYDKSVSINNFNHAITQLKERFPSIQIIDYQYRRDYIYGIFGMSLIFLFGISLMVAIVLTVKINATFAGEYENRTFEFSLYKAIGFSTKEIVAKIIREIILINALGLMLGIALSLSIVFILNEFVLNSLGMALDFFCAEAVISSFLCEIIILTTVISFQVAGIKKCDITQF
jgi:ABC-type antimicrobial peptide transport system permease subunit